jgi:hypothetical protein
MCSQSRVSCVVAAHILARSVAMSVLRELSRGRRRKDDDDVTRKRSSQNEKLAVGKDGNVIKHPGLERSMKTARK